MRKLTTLALTGAVALGLSGCAQMHDNTAGRTFGMDNETVGAVGGGAAGALVGTVLAGPIGTAIGAGAGAYLGDQYGERHQIVPK